MADREQPYDPYVPSGQNAAAPGQNGNQRTAQLQAVSQRAEIPLASFHPETSMHKSSPVVRNTICMSLSALRCRCLLDYAPKSQC